MEQKHYECPQCSSTNIDLISEDYGICKSCGTKINFKDNETPKQVIKNDVYIVKKGGRDDFDTKNLVIKPENSEKEFFRQACIDLARNDTTPADIFKSDFRPVTKSYQQMLGVDAEVTLNYSVSIGYNRTEEYFVTVKEYDRDLQCEVEKKVKKTRTVTDWSPTSGTYSGEITSYVFNDDKITDDSFRICSSFDCDRFEDSYSRVKSSSVFNVEDVDFKTDYPKNVSQKALTFAKADCISKASVDCQEKLPGDVCKDFSSSSVCKPKKVSCIVAPEYSLNYVHDGQEYTKKAFAFGGMPMSRSDANAEKDIQKEINKKSMPMIIAGTILTILSIALSLTVRNLPVICAVFGIAVVSVIVGAIVYRSIEKKVKNGKKAMKIEQLNEFLKKNGLGELSQSEIETIKK
ncbi:MAG: hypothetical protein ACI4MZ_02365 [Christensenellales bacterium]